MSGVPHLLGLLVALALPLAPEEMLLDQVVAVVDRDVITESQMLVEMRVALAWRHGPRAAAALALPRQPRGVAPVLSAAAREAAGLADDLQHYVINQYLMAGQVRRQGTELIGDDELTARLLAFAGRFGVPREHLRFLRDFGVRPSVLRDILRRDLANERFVATRLRGRVVDEAGAGGGDRALQEWLAQLRQHVEIRTLGPGGTLELQQPQ